MVHHKSNTKTSLPLSMEGPFLDQLVTKTDSGKADTQAILQCAVEGGMPVSRQTLTLLDKLPGALAAGSTYEASKQQEDKITRDVAVLQGRTREPGGPDPQVHPGAGRVRQAQAVDKSTLGGYQDKPTFR